jgi:hypothetical protein
MNTYKWMTWLLILGMLLVLVNSSQVTPAEAQADLPTIGQAGVLSQQASGEVPVGLSGEQWVSIQEQIRLAEYQFTWQVLDGVWAFRAFNRAQGLDLAFSQAGLTAVGSITSRGAPWRFRVHLAAYGNEYLPAVISQRGLSAERANVTYRWNASLSEKYTNTPQGVEQTLMLYAPPDSGDLSLDFEIAGGLYPILDDSGVLKLLNARGIEVLGYDHWIARDVTGREWPVRLAFADGELHITIEAAGGVFPLRVIALLQSETSVLHASDPQIEDYFGYSVAVSGDLIVVGSRFEDGGVGDPISSAGAAYVFERAQDRADNWGEVQTLHASDAQSDDQFGYSVAISGDVIVIGAPYEDGGADDPLPLAGAAYVFQRTPGNPDEWSEVKILHASDAQEGDYFGLSAVISDDVIAVGAHSEDGGAGNPQPDAGAAYVFQRMKGGEDEWGEAKILHASDIQSGDGFGVRVAISCGLIVVGAHYEDGGVGDPYHDSGAAYIFQRTQGGVDGWGEVKILHASDIQMEDDFGRSVAISGDVIVVGAPGEDGGTGDPAIDSGAAYIFQRMQGGANEWGELKILHASDAQAGDEFGIRVSISEDVIVAGARFEDGGDGNPVIDAGAAYIFQRTQGGSDGWGEVQILHAFDLQASDAFGFSVDVWGDVIITGAPYEDGGMNDPVPGAGAAYVFQREGQMWVETAINHASGPKESGQFGYSVAISGDVMVVTGEDNTSIPHSGGAYVFNRTQGGADGWGEVQIIRASDAQYDDHMLCPAISGDVIICGAAGEDGGPGNPYPDSGAAYVFERIPGGEGEWSEVQILHASDAQAADWFGNNAAVVGDVIAVNAYGEDGGTGDPLDMAGAVYIFQRMQGGADEWGEVKILHASDAQAGDQFGVRVALSGDYLFATAYGEDGGAGNPHPDAGAAYVFQRSQGGADAWGEVQILNASDAQTGDQFGNSIAISGEVLVVGAVWEDGGTGNPHPDSGAAYVFQRSPGISDVWGEVKILRASDAQADDGFGGRVAVSSDVILVGAFGEDGGPGDTLLDAGAAYIFQRTQDGPDNWGELQILHASDAQAGDLFGFWVAVWGDVIVVGAPHENGGAGDPIVWAGAAYIFHVYTGNHPPQLDPIGDQSGEEEMLISFTAKANDPDSGDTLVFSLDPGSPDGSSIDPVSGTFTWIPAEVQAPGVYTVTVRVTDDGVPPMDVFENLLITVSEVNQAPVIDPIDNLSVDEGKMISLTVSASDYDIPTNTLVFSLEAGAPYGANIDPTSGVFNWMPDEAQGPGVYTITVRVTDDGIPPMDDFETIQITVGEVNQAPEIEPIGNLSDKEGKLISFTVNVMDSDIPTNTIVFSLDESAPDGASIDPVSGVFTWTPDETQGSDVYLVTVLVADNGIPPMDDFESFLVNVSEGNQAPVMEPIGNQSGDEGELISFTASATDNDIPTNTLTFSLEAGAPDGANIDPVIGIFTWTPDETQGPGVYTVTLRVTDDGVSPLNDFKSLHITVDEVNQSPMLDSIGNQSGYVDSLISFTATAIDGDIPTNTLVFSLNLGAPDGASIDPASGVFTWTPSETQGAGVYLVTVIVTDDGIPTLDDFESLLVTVSEPPPPILRTYIPIMIRD